MGGVTGRAAEAFASLEALVVGEAILDVYLDGYTERLAREAPVPIVNVCRRELAPGGAANTAANVRSLAARVHYLSVAGDDEEGWLLGGALRARGLEEDLMLVQPGRRTLTKSRVSASSQMLVRFDGGTTEPVDASVESDLIERMGELYRRCDVVIISDYDYGVFTPRVIRAIAALQGRHRKVLVVDSKRLSSFRSADVSAVKPNYEEAARLLNITELEGNGGRVGQIMPHGDRILQLTGARMAAVTLDSDGAILFERGSRHPYRTYAKPAATSCATGAGDSFVAALALSLAAGMSAIDAVEVASAAAAVVVGKSGTSSCSSEELLSYQTIEGKILAGETLRRKADFYRGQGKRIVFTNGCFDILHRGHITYLNKAKSLGDVLVVGINSDASVRRIKGEGRPINNLEDRMQVLSAMSCVDHLAAFDEDTPEELIRALEPHVFVKGGDYTMATLPEAGLVRELGGEVEILPYIEERSTTALIEKIRGMTEGVAAR